MGMRELDWNNFDDGDLEGMEAFVEDDFSIHIVKYKYGEGYHWLARQWNDEDKCEVTASYDYPETQDGFAFMTDAYVDAMAYMRDIGIISDTEEQQATAPSGIRKFLDSAMRLGFAAAISVTSFLGSISSPVLAYADENVPDGSDIYLQSAEKGWACVMAPAYEESSDEVWALIENDQLVQVEPGSDLYNLVLDELDAGFPSAGEGVCTGMIGIPYGERDPVVVLNKSGEEFQTKLTHSGLNNAYREWCEDGIMHGMTAAFLYYDCELKDRINLYIANENRQYEAKVYEQRQAAYKAHMASPEYQAQLEEDETFYTTGTIVVIALVFLEMSPVIIYVASEAIRSRK